MGAAWRSHCLEVGITRFRASFRISRYRKIYMARAHNILTLAKHSLDNNRDQVINSLRAISANEPPNSSLRTRLERMLQRTPTAPAAIVPPDIAKLVRQENPVLPLGQPPRPKGRGLSRNV